jgi:hypothetical protein
MWRRSATRRPAELYGHAVTGESWTCRGCGQRHADLPFSYGTVAPAFWPDALADDDSSVLDDEVCVINGAHFFVRARIVIPVRDAATDFDWGVWVSLSATNFARTTDLWITEGREAEEPYFGWLSTDLPVYEPTTLGLKTHVHTQPVGTRPLVELEPTDHPLAVEQRTGITVARVREIAELVRHAG